MFTVGAFVAIAIVVWYARRQEASERKSQPGHVDDDFARERVLFIREDIRLIAYILMAILVMLGVIADRLH